MKLTKAFVKHAHGGDVFYINPLTCFQEGVTCEKLPFIVAYSFDFGEDGKTMVAKKDIALNLNNVIYIHWYENNTIEVED